jgi:hypothetical protein
MRRCGCCGGVYPGCEDGWPTAARSLLARQLEPPTLAEAAQVLLGGVPPEPDELALRRLERLGPTLSAPADLPWWATRGIQLGDEVTYAHPTLDLDEAEAVDGLLWPPATVAAYQVTDELPVILIEVGPSAPPTWLELILMLSRSTASPVTLLRAV